MLRLAILRHAEALPIAEGGDLERALAPAGLEMAERMGRFFRNNDLAPDLGLVSPAVRTRETFEALERGAGRSFKSEVVPALYNASVETLAEIVAAVPKEIKLLLLVGHNPGFAELANMLAGKGKKADLAKMSGHFPAPCLALIEFDRKDWSKIEAGDGRLDIYLTRGALAKSPAGDER
jgi:phosphohistidine phosphatase